MPKILVVPDLEDEQLRKMLASPLKSQKREGDFESSRKPRVSGKPDAMSSFDGEPTLNTFLARNRGNEAGDQFESSVQSVVRFADTSNVVRSLLEGNKDHWLHQARSELMKQEHQVGSLNNCTDELQQKAYAKRLELEDAHHGYAESRGKQVRRQEELVVKEKALRDSQTRSMHEMGEMKRARELRVEEFSIPKLRKSHETIQRLSLHNHKNCKKG